MKTNELENNGDSPNGSDLSCNALFDVGDLVRHRASGQVGVIEYVNTKCQNPKHTHAYHCMSGQGCERVPCGTYDLSTGIGESADSIDGFLLAHVDGTEDFP